VAGRASRRIPRRRSREIVGILLAAGSSTRFGSNKLLHPLPDGTPLAVASLRNLRAAVPRVLAVIRPGAAELERLLREGRAEVTICDRAYEGMGTTLAHSVRASGDADGWVVALADMPFIRPETIRRVVERLEAGAQIVAPVWRGKRGHPVGFAGRFRADLERLTGDAGARELLKARAGSLELVECDDPGAVRDVDRPEDLA
jgi:molybdenum cofactor cytidylyltransferase